MRPVQLRAVLTMARTRNFQVETKFLTLSLPVELMDRLDAEVGRVRVETPHQPVSRADFVRHLLSQGLDIIDKHRQIQKAHE